MLNKIVIKTTSELDYDTDYVQYSNLEDLEGLDGTVYMLENRNLYFYIKDEDKKDE